jgi:hypothetical protein
MLLNTTKQGYEQIDNRVRKGGFSYCTGRTSAQEKAHRQRPQCTPNTGLSQLGKEEAAIVDSASTERPAETEFVEVQLKEPGRFISARAYALKARPSVLDVINVHSLRSDETNVLTNDITCQPHGTQAPQTPSLCQRTGNGLYPAPPSVEVLEPGRICRRQNARSLLPHCGLQ